MIVIVEGPDGAGKTSLITDLVRCNQNTNVIHFGAPETEAEAFEYWRKYASTILSSPKDSLTIFDRSWFSDHVYAPILRNREEMSSVMMKLLNALMVHHGGGYVIYCTAPTKTLWKRCKERGEKLVTSYDMLNRIKLSYDDMFSNVADVVVIKYDTSN